MGTIDSRVFVTLTDEDNRVLQYPDLNDFQKEIVDAYYIARNKTDVLKVCRALKQSLNKGGHRNFEVRFKGYSFEIKGQED